MMSGREGKVERTKREGEGPEGSWMGNSRKVKDRERGRIGREEGKGRKGKGDRKGREGKKTLKIAIFKTKFSTMGSCTHSPFMI